MTLPESHLAQEAIAALVDGELTAGPANRAARHLLGCAQCRLAVAAQREAKEALHRAADVAVPNDLLSRLQAIPFTTDVPGGGPGSMAAGADEVTLTGARGAFSFPLASAVVPAPRRDQARWLRRGMIGTVAALGAGVTALALTLPAGNGSEQHGPSAVSPGQHTTIVPPVVRTVTVGDTGPLPGSAAGGPAAGDGTP